jgi:hypothetical protein
LTKVDSSFVFFENNRMKGRERGERRPLKEFGRIRTGNGNKHKSL